MEISHWEEIIFTTNILLATCTFGDCSFTCTVPTLTSKLRNNLPWDIRNPSNLVHFMHLLKTHLLREAYSHCSQYFYKTVITLFIVSLLVIWVGGTVASWLVHSTPERAVRVQALTGDIVLCSWATHFTLTVPLSTQVYKWVPANLMLGGNPVMD